MLVEISPKKSDESEEEISWIDELDGGSTEEVEDSGKIDFVELTDQLQSTDNVVEFYQLPRHERCASHSLNLVATVDARKKVDRQFKSLFRSTESKLQQLWNKQNRSSVASDLIQSKLSGLFTVPNQTRWNSFYAAVARVKFYLGKNADEMREIFEHFTIPFLRPAEEEVIKEYTRILYPVTRALDILQADKKIGAGFLLPTIVTLRIQLAKLEKDSTHHSRSLILSIQEGLRARFDHLFQDSSLRLAAMTHPRFKLSWVPEDELETAELFLRDAVKDEQQREGGSFNFSVIFFFTFFVSDLRKKSSNNIFIYFYIVAATNYLRECDEDYFGLPGPSSKKARLDEDFFKTIRPKAFQVEVEEVDKFLNE